MQLRNKKTGEIIELLAKPSFVKRTENYLDSEVNTFDSLAEFNEEWEDYKEPSKTIWQIKDSGELQDFEEDVFSDGYIESSKSIGNYFETREEAEKAVEKLKAWKLLKDELNIKFDGIIRDDRAMLKGVKVKYDRHEVTFDRMRKCVDALHLLFGGEK